MKNLRIQKRMMTLAIASTMVLTAPGMLVNAEENFEQKVATWTQHISLPTEAYSLIYLNNELILVTHEKMYDDYGNQITKYYQVGTNRFIGQTIEENCLVRMEQRMDTLGEVYALKSNIPLGIKKVTITNDVNDYCYFNGEYGIGKNIPKEAVTPFSAFVSTEYPTDEDIFFFSINSSESKSVYEEYKKYANHHNINSITYSIDLNDWYAIMNNFHDRSKRLLPSDLSYEINYEDEYLIKYSFYDLDGEKNTFVGYRCAKNASDKGYHYVYDVLTGCIYDMSSLRQEDIMSEIMEQEYTISELKNEMNLLSETTNPSIDYKKVDSISLGEDGTVSFLLQNNQEVIMHLSYNEFIQRLLLCNNLKYFIGFQNDLERMNTILECISNPSQLDMLSLYYVGEETNSTFNMQNLKRFDNLKVLDLDNCGIKDIRVLSYLQELTDVTLNNNSISDIQVLQELPNLSWVKLNNNCIPEYHFQFLIDNGILNETDCKWQFMTQKKLGKQLIMLS